MQTEPSKAGPPKLKRRWCQFSLRTLMIGVTLVAALCPVCIPALRRWLEHNDAIVAIDPYLTADVFANTTEKLKRVRRHDGRLARRRQFIHVPVRAPTIVQPGIPVPGPPHAAQSYAS